MKVIAYPTTIKPDVIRAANSKRDWMDTAVAKNPYRCLPLSMANSWGWEILSRAKFTATWDGGQGANSVRVVIHEGENAPSSHFGEATLTWHSGYVFKTPYPYGMYVTGAPNNPKSNVIPLSGVVETHWLAYTFTMNWRFTKPGSFTMEIGEPYCQIFPVDMNMFDMVVPEIRTLAEDKEFHDLYWDWNISRSNYMTERSIPGSKVSDPDIWQRHYFQGKYPPGKVHPEGAKCPFHITEDGKTESVHRTKPNVPEFVDLQTEPFASAPDYVERTREINEMYNNYIKSRQTKTDFGPTVHRSDEEIQERINYHEQVLRQQAAQMKTLQTIKQNNIVTVTINDKP